MAENRILARSEGTLLQGQASVMARLGDKTTLLRVIFVLILLTGIFARTWEFDRLPPGLNQDEASSGVDAFSLYHFGVDRNGVSYPVHFISWGSGQNALYAYAMIPFIAAGGLTRVTVRLPMLITGILSLPLLYVVARRTLGRRFALVAMLLLAISPWHIILSRWGLESNLLPFVFLLGYACILKSTGTNFWFVPAAVLFALSLYAYGTAYVAVPVFMACAIVILLAARRVGLRSLGAGLAAFAIVAAPIGLFLLTNTLKWESLHLGPLTMERLPSQPRFEMLGAVFSGNLGETVAQNLKTLLGLLWQQSDGLPWNGLDPYGYFYRYTLPIAVLGAGLLFVPARGRAPERLLLLSWLAAGLTVGVLQPVNINRINVIFLPLILCMAVPLAWDGEGGNPVARAGAAGRASRYLQWVQAAALCVLLAGFTLFTRDYHGPAYRDLAERAFFDGLLPAINAARASGEGQICVTDGVNEPYIFALFAEQMNPADYVDTVTYVNPGAPFQKVSALGRYRFGLDHCQPDARTVYVLRAEQAPQTGASYTVEDFGRFRVFKPLS